MNALLFRKEHADVISQESRQSVVSGYITQLLQRNLKSQK